MSKKDIVIFLVLVMVLIVLLLPIGRCADSKVAEVKEKTTEAVLPEPEKVSGPEVKQGSYTIFQYCQNGWTNHLYATSYYKQDYQVYAELREYPGEYVPIDGQTLILPEWIEDPNELMNYGFWEPMESDWDL